MSEERAAQGQVDHLIQCLETELTLSDELLQLSKDQQQSLVHHAKEQIADAASAQDAKLRQLAAARKRSEAAAASIAASLQLENESPTLAELASALGQPYGTLIEETTFRLVNAASALYEQNLMNSNLLTNAVEYVTFCMRLLSGADQQAPYKPRGVTQARPNALLLDQTV